MSEPENLKRQENLEFGPKVYGFGWNSKGLLQEQYLIIEYLDNAHTVDSMLLQHPEKAENILLQIQTLFNSMLSQNFIHLDPHPKNIMLLEDGNIKLIDFEFCLFKVNSLEVTLGFILGYFYHYWLNKFMSKEKYNELSMNFIEDEYPNISETHFKQTYSLFRDHKVSRENRYKILTSKKPHEKTYQHIKNTHAI